MVKNQETSAQPNTRKTNSRTTGVECLERLTQSFEISARRWELIVYPALFAFIVLASYGFYLIFSLTKDISFISRSVDKNMGIIAQRMDHMTKNIDVMTVNVEHMSINMRNISRNITTVSETMGTMEPMLTNMSSMNRSLRTMTIATTQMRNDLGSMNHNVSRPMTFMNSFMPW